MVHETEGPLWPIELSELQLSQFARYYAMLVDWNERINLTGIVDRDEVYIKHFYDSLAVSNLPLWQEMVRRGARAIDIGSGAGFPGIPLAIAYPNMSFVLCDALQKRIHFLQAVCSDLGLNNVACIHGRSEDMGRDSALRGAFDVALARAVARANVLMEYMAPFLKSGGVGICYKGPSFVHEEFDDAKRAAPTLHCRLLEPLTYELPHGLGSRALAPFIQMQPVPKAYPRRAGIPTKQPL
ncbi:16S rRNA m(7)G-527 methyltransferase [Alicyclobacillus sacchari]|uniref:Ribosomal RNA small subunit methyltransferase G n=1 Tax=Alicyclobacillus sacchari TaxID=392010 RepID=A0A4V3HDU6_9BACL|nr:16S rRNA (guanine(527)-N(7))-methyltransferase RsmG [Alicyclobacillus sacchari]TDY42386.1 16S rRNA m(7)G-527 methyltransferase [Alicyclobacillus sacchari]GMA57321.1 ribosomal RNA small subunit methyltransferase G [Alicyclobacillus sacchari]